MAVTRWPEGLQSAGVAAGIKGGDALDLGLLVADGPAVWGGTFTTNAPRRRASPGVEVV
ncbi:MAG: hypothetical protein ACR2H7_10760 [Actinomycetota bacterium]